MKKLGKVLSIVENVLAENEMARNDDFFLFYQVCLKLGINMNKITARDLFVSHNTLDVPSYESVSRCRRKLQAEGKYLAKDKIKTFRNTLENQYREDFA